jgi:transcriptional regulator with XRE-family HTH domain
MTFGQCLKAWREYRGLSQTELDDVALVYHYLVGYLEAERYWERHEHETPYMEPIQEVCRLAKALGCTVEQLVEGVGPRGEAT